MDDGRMVMSKITGVVNFHMKLTQGLEVTETSYETLFVFVAMER